jgi:acetyl-CoA carboxylase biotin carboxyl carrier protein
MATGTPAPDRGDGDGNGEVGRSPVTGLATELTAAVRRLAGDLPAGVRRMAVRVGDAAVEVEWAEQPAALTGPAGSDADAQPAPGGRPAPDRATPQRAAPAVCVPAPTVGVFYHRPEPGKPPYVSVGQRIDPDTVVGIVEAMKMMNKVTADRSGTVREFLVPDGAAVEYGQPLIELSVESSQH